VLQGHLSISVFLNGMIRTCKISTDKRLSLPSAIAELLVTIAQSIADHASALNLKSKTLV